MPQVRFIVVLWGGIKPDVKSIITDSAPGATLITWPDLLQLGSKADVAAAWRPVQLDPEQLATLVYTSGTTGEPRTLIRKRAHSSPRLHACLYQPASACLSCRRQHHQLCP